MQALMYRNNGTVQVDSIYDHGMMKSQSDRTMTLSENLKKFRAARGLTQPQVWGAGRHCEIKLHLIRGGHADAISRQDR